MNQPQTQFFPSTAAAAAAAGANTPSEPSFLAPYFSRLAKMDAVRSVGAVTRAAGLIVESKGPAVSVGDLCRLETRKGEPETLLEAVGFRDNQVLLMPLNAAMPNVRVGQPVVAAGVKSEIAVGEKLLGRVIDALGRPLDGLGEIEAEDFYPLNREATNPLARQNITETLGTGVRLIDGFLTVGAGQRIGIFGGSGVGKSTLLGMMAKRSQAQINVIALIGERGREVREFIENELGEEGMARSVVVVSTSDDSALLRIRAALAATAIAETAHPDGARAAAVTPLRELSLAVREHALPIWQVDFADARNSSYFVSGTTGDILERRNDTWRWWDFFWMLHNMDYAKRTSFNHPLIVFVGFAMAWLAVTGFWLLFRTMWRHDASTVRSWLRPGAK